MGFAGVSLAEQQARAKFKQRKAVQPVAGFGVKPVAQPVAAGGPLPAVRPQAVAQPRPVAGFGGPSAEANARARAMSAQNGDRYSQSSIARRQFEQQQQARAGYSERLANMSPDQRAQTLAQQARFESTTGAAPVAGRPALAAGPDTMDTRQPSGAQNTGGGGGRSGAESWRSNPASGQYAQQLIAGGMDPAIADRMVTQRFAGTSYNNPANGGAQNTPQEQAAAQSRQTQWDQRARGGAAQPPSSGVFGRTGSMAPVTAAQDASFEAARQQGIARASQPPAGAGGGGAQDTRMPYQPSGAQNTGGQAPPPGLGGQTRPGGNWYENLDVKDKNLFLSKEERDALGGYRQYRESSGEIRDLPSTTDDYNRVSGGAGDYLNDLFQRDPGGGGGQPDMGFDPNDFRNQGRGMIDNRPGAQPRSERPEFQGPGGPYQRPDTWGDMSPRDTSRTDRFADAGYDMLSGDQGRPDLGGVRDYERPDDARFDYANQGRGGFDSNSVAGPNVSRIGERDMDFSGRSGSPGFQEALDAAKGFGGGNTGMARENLPGPVGRENIQGSGFQSNELFSNPNSVANRGYNAALGANQGLANANLSADTSALDAATQASETDVFNRAALAGRNAAGARGATAAEGTIAGGEMGTRLGEAARASAADRQRSMVEAKLQTMGLQGQQRMAGAQGLTGLGSAASESGARNAGLLQGENQALAGFGLQQRGQDIGQNETAGRLGVEQRGQDIQNAQFGANLSGQNLQGVASLINATGGQSTDYMRAQTERELGRGRLGLDTGTANQAGELGGYEAQTGRMGTQGEIAGRSDAARTAQFEAETGRGLGEEAGRRAAEAQGLDWNTLDANQRMELNRAENTRYQTDVNREGQRLDAAGNLMQTSGQQGFQERELEQNARQFAAQLGKDYDSLSAQERNDINTQANERYQTDVSGELGRGEQANTRSRDELNAATDFYRTDAAREGNYLQKEQEMGRQGIDIGRLSADIINNKSTAQQAANNLVAQGIFTDMAQAMQYITERTRQEQARWQTNRQGQQAMYQSIVPDVSIGIGKGGGG